MRPDKYLKQKGKLNKLGKPCAIIIKMGDAFAVTSTKFDSDTGEELASEMESLDLNALLLRKKALEAEIAGLDIMIADCVKAEAAAVAKEMG